MCHASGITFIDSEIMIWSVFVYMRGLFQRCVSREDKWPTSVQAWHLEKISARLALWLSQNTVLLWAGDVWLICRHLMLEVMIPDAAGVLCCLTLVSYIILHLNNENTRTNLSLTVYGLSTFYYKQKLK